MKRLFGFLALAGLVTFGAPVAPVQAASLIGPGAAAQTKVLTDDLAIEVRHGGGGFRGGGGGFRGFHGGGGRHFGGAHFGGPRFVAGPRFVGGPGFVHRHRFVHHRPFIVRRHVWRPYPYHYYYAEPRLYCRRVWTDFGPRRICRYRPWWA
jgi:hypothetical protein